MAGGNIETGYPKNGRFLRLRKRILVLRVGVGSGSSMD